MYFKQVTGKFGEDLACEYLKKLNYIIIERNFSCYQGEIDIIARDSYKNELVFVEVKTRTSFKYGYPIDAVDKHKQNHLFKACEYYLYSHNLRYLFVRVDVIEVFINNGIPHIRHVKQVL